MALVVCLHDPDAVRRLDTLDRIQSEPLPCPGALITRIWSHGNWSILCRTSPAMPMAEHDSPKCHALMAGKLLDPDLNIQRMDISPVHPIGGFGMHVRVDKNTGGIEIDTDFLGLFPVYYASGDDWMMASSSPWFFRCHPGFTPSWDLEGIAGLLQTMHLVNNQTVWAGVRRLESGHRLEGMPGRIFRTRRMYLLPHKPVTAPVDGETLFHRLDQVLKAWLLEDRPRTVLLSGGLDSRLLAGMLNRIPGSPPSAITMGIDRDLEVRCAKLVAEELGMRHAVWEFGADDLFESFRRTAILELASNGMNTTTAYATTRGLAAGTCLLTGLFLDTLLVSSLHYHGAFSSSTQSVINYFGSWGFDLDALARLRPDRSWHEANAAVAEHLHRSLLDCPAQPLHRAAEIYEIYGRQRHHTGGMGWRFAWNAWPLMPSYDAPTMAMAWSTPDDTRKDREVEREMLRRHFPALARIPLDNNTVNPHALLPAGRRHHWARRLLGRPSLHVAPARDTSELRYFRVMDINAPHWRNLRERVEPLREKLHGLFDPAALEELLPGPGVTIPLSNPMSESSGRKTLIGLMLIADAVSRGQSSV